MRLVTVSMIAFCLHVSAKTLSQTITLSGTAMPLQKVFAEIKSQTGTLFFYRNEDLADSRPVSLQLQSTSLPKALEIILGNQPLRFDIQGNTVFISRRPPAAIPVPIRQRAIADTDAIYYELHGIIFDEENKPMPNVTIRLQGNPSRGTATSVNGLFTFYAPVGSTLLITNVGYYPSRIKVQRNPEGVAIHMTRSDTRLDQVQVIAYGSTTRSLLTSPISTVKSEDLRNFPMTSFDQMLQGLAPGVFIQASSGAPGKIPYLNIRGRNSINGASPLYIIDGMPISTNPLDPTSFDLDPLIGIDPADIVSIDILKDAGSTAIYGSRAAGGVILVTTKHGRQGQTVFTVNGTQGVGIPTGRLHLLKTSDYIALRKEGFLNDNPSSPLPADLAGLDAKTETNWQNLVYKPTMIGEYKIAASGGNAETQFYLTSGFRKETNPLSGKKGLDRETFRLNLDHREGRRLKISANIAASRTDDQNTANGNNTYSATTSALAAPPDSKPFDSSGNYTNIPLISGVGNPLAVFAVKMDNKILQLKTSMNINYEIVKGFAFHTDMGYEYNTLTEKIYIPKAVNATLNNPLYDAAIINSTTGTYSIEPQLRLNRTWNRVNSLDAVAGTSFQKRSTANSYLYGKGFPSDDIQEMDAAAKTFGSSGDGTYAFNSLFGRVNYIYNSKYIVNASFRRDGSSRFGPGDRFGNFWAVSGGWLFGRESFARNWQFLSTGKLRGSYGIVGNDAIGDFTYLDLWQPIPYGNQPGARPVSAESPDVHWERTAKFDVGLDLGFLRDRIGITLNYYDNRTDNLLVTEPVASQTGFSTVENNMPGQVKNNGVELELNTVNIRTAHFQWSTKLNLTHQQNILNRFPGLATNTGYNLNYQVGQTLNLLWGYKFRAVDPNTGTPIYDGFNLDGTPKDPTALNPGRQIIGKFSPAYFGGLINNFTWKGFSLDVFLQFVQGLDAFNDEAQLNNSSSSNANQVTDVLNRWRNKGDITNTPRSATQSTAWWVTSNIDNLSSRFISDGSYLRIKNVTLSYSLPATTLAKWKIKELRIYASGTNLGVLTHFKGVDPETGSDVAPTRMITGGVNLAF